MFGNSHSTDSLQRLVAEIKTYIELQKSYAKLELTEKLTVLLSTLILVMVLIILSMVALFYLSFTLAYILAPHVGGLMVSFGIMTLCIVLLIIMVYAFREKLIFSPMVNFLGRLFLGEYDKEETSQEEEDDL